MAVLGQHFPDHCLGVFDLGGIVLPFLGKSDLFLFEAVEQIRLGDGVESGVIDLADSGLFLDENVQDNALLGVLTLDTQVFEIACVPQGVEVALDGDGIVGVADVGKESGEDGLLGNAAVANDPYLIDGLTQLGKGCDCREQQRQEKHCASKTSGSRQGAVKTGFPETRLRLLGANGSVLDLHRAVSPRRAQKRQVRSMVQIHARNMHTLIAEKVVLPSRKV